MKNWKIKNIYIYIYHDRFKRIVQKRYKNLEIKIIVAKERDTSGSRKKEKERGG